MPIPELNDAGCLPPGVHDCSLPELREQFGRFQSSDRRPRLFEKLEEFLAKATATDLFSEIIVDGSFVTAKPDPGDIDLLLVLQEGHDEMATPSPVEYNLLSRKRLRTRYGFDALVASFGSSDREAALAFFSQVRQKPELEKGLLRVGS